MSRRLALLVASLAPAAVGAQGGAWHADLSGGVGSDGRRVAVSVLRDLRGAESVVQLAIGGRLSWYTGDTIAFALRDGEPTCGTSTVDCVPAEIRIDPSVVGWNLFGEVSVRVVRGVRLGANLDLLGVAAGPSRDDDQPARWSLFLYGNRDRGSLNSEFFADLVLSERVRIRGGVSHYVIGYERTGANGGTARYQRFLDAAFVAVRVGL